MDWIKEIEHAFKIIGFHLSLIIAGIAGAFVSNSIKKLSIMERAFSVISGGLIANYVTPVIVDLMNLSISTSNGIAFLMGYMGLKAVELVIERIKRVKEE